MDLLRLKRVVCSSSGSGAYGASPQSHADFAQFLCFVDSLFRDRLRLVVVYSTLEDIRLE